MSPESITFLMRRIADIEQAFGTLTNKFEITHSAPAPELSAADLLNFRWIVENGIMKDARFKPPEGYRILDFLTYLRELQQQQYARTVNGQRDELNTLYLKSKHG